MFRSTAPSPLVHKDYLSNMEAYSCCERFWLVLFDEIVTASGQAQSWMPFGRGGISFGDGTYLDPVQSYRELKGTSPILRMVAPQSSKGLMINQAEASELPEAPDYPERGWIDVGLDEGLWRIQEIEKDVDMMRIWILLTEDRLPPLTQFIRKWIVPGTTVESMRLYLKEQMPST